MITYSENNWLHDVQDCVNELSSNDFTLDDVYQFESRLATVALQKNKKQIENRTEK